MLEMTSGEKLLDLCACKGIRKCAICDPNRVEMERDEEQRQMALNKNQYVYCGKCDLAIRLTAQSQIENYLQSEKNLDCNCKQADKSDTLYIAGIRLKENFINANEESMLIDEMNRSKWVDSQSGRYKQDFGPKANFNKKKLKYATFTGLPHYSKFLVDRFGPFANDFVPVEMCNLKYESKRGACIDPHLDDVWLWGNRLITVNLLSNTFLTLKPIKQRLEQLGDCEVLIPLSRFSLLILADEARYEWFHAIKKTHITSTRIAITFRELSDEFKHKPVATDIEKLALSYRGVPVGDLEHLFSEHSTKLMTDLTWCQSDFSLELDGQLKQAIFYKLKELNYIENLSDFIKAKMLKSTNKKEMQLVYENSQNSKQHLVSLSTNKSYTSLCECVVHGCALEMPQTAFFTVNINQNHEVNAIVQEYREMKYFELKNENHIEHLIELMTSWQNLAQQETTTSLNVLNISQESSINDYLRNILRIDDDFECYKLRFVEIVKASKNMTLGMKSMSIATVESMRRLICCSKPFRRTLMLGDFKPQNLNFKDDKKLEIQTSLTRVKCSFIFHDMAIFINEALFQMFETNSYDEFVIDLLVNAIKMRTRLEEAELNLLHHLILLEYILKLLFSSPPCLNEHSIETNFKELFLNKTFLFDNRNNKEKK